MFPPENEVRESSLQEMGSRTIEAGTVEGVLGWLFPDACMDTRRDIEQFICTVGSTLPPVDDGDGVIVVRGSSGHRIVYKSLTGADSPFGFGTVARVWSGLVDDPIYNLKNCEEAHVLADCVPDLDLVVDASVVLEQGLRETARMHPESNAQVFIYDGIPIVEVISPGVTFEMHHLPDMDLADSDHRVSMWLPLSEAFGVAFIRPDGSVYVDAFSQTMLASDRVSAMFGTVHKTQAIVGAQRALSTHYTYRDIPVGRYIVEYDRIGLPVSYFINDDAFWKNAASKSSAHDIEQRQTEMTIGFMRLLTQNPGNLVKHRPLFDQTQMVSMLGPDFTIDHDPNAYQQSYRSGTLKPEESGVALLAKQLDLSIPEVIEGLQVRV